MSWLALLFALELGWLPGGMIEQYSIRYERADSFYTDLDAEVLIADLFFIGGNVQTIVHWYPVFNWEPTLINYGFRAGIRKDMLTVFWRHTCTHPVVTYMHTQPGIAWEGGYNEICIRIEGKIGGE